VTRQEGEAPRPDQVTTSVSALLRRSPPVLADRGTFSRRRRYRSHESDRTSPTPFARWRATALIGIVHEPFLGSPPLMNKVGGVTALCEGV
jgi:hypothetical protein